MTKISNDTVYIIDTDVSDLDSLIGSDGNTSKKRTKNFLLGQLKSYFKSGLSPLTGGVLRFTEITYSGSSYATHAAVLNNLDPVFVVEQYHVVVVNLNGAKSILKLQNQTVGKDLPLVLNTDFIALPTSVGAAGPQGIQGIQGIQGPAGANGTNGTNGATGPQGLQGLPGTNGANGTNGTNGIDASNNLQRDATVSFTLSDSDNNYVIQLKNTADIIITVPISGLRTKFNAGFVRLGIGEVRFLGESEEESVTVNNPVGLSINRIFDPAYIERDANTQVYTLFGNTKSSADVPV